MKPIDPIALLRKKVSESSQAEVAAAVGVSETLISLVLAGERKITGKLADYLGLSVETKLVYVYRRKRKVGAQAVT